MPSVCPNLVLPTQFARICVHAKMLNQTLLAHDGLAVSYLDGEAVLCQCNFLSVDLSTYLCLCYTLSLPLYIYIGSRGTSLT